MTDPSRCIRERQERQKMTRRRGRTEQNPHERSPTPPTYRWSAITWVEFGDGTLNRKYIIETEGARRNITIHILRHIGDRLEISGAG
ncbi:hypothetical protein [Nocardia alni]|uniref:hypothetical protein n=1 Tax=Nocardia alni TaxID=2815723 RepID=UPI001C2429F4|nr:hypothetical protein [Nocardia alni]